MSTNSKSEYFNFDEIPLQAGCRWFVRYGDETRHDRGFKTKSEANDWIQALGRRMDWRVGFIFRLRGDNVDIAIVDREGNLARP